MKILAIILSLVFLFGIIYFFYRIKDKNFKRNIFIFLFLIKILGGFSVYVVYTYFMDPSMADIYKYYRGGKAFYNATNESFTDYIRLITGIQGDKPHLQKYYDQTDFWTREHSYGLFNDTRTIIRFNALACLISNGNIYVHIFLMAFLSFLGCFVLYKAFDELSPEINPYFKIIAAFLVPSCVFWTSGLLKEGLLMFAIGFTTWFAVKLSKKFSFLNFIGFCISAAMIFLSKIYILPAFIPALFFFFISRNLNIKNQLILFFSILLFSAVFVVFSDKLIGYNILQTLSGKQNDFLNYTSLLEDKGSTFDLPRLQPDFISLVKLVPRGFINSMFRPFPREINSIFMFFSFLEVLLIVGMIFLAAIFFKKPENKNTVRVILFCLTFILYLNILVGIIIPNTGSLVRYRTPGLIFLFYLLFIIIDWAKLKSKMYKLFPHKS